jgi:hypothetical protein
VCVRLGQYEPMMQQLTQQPGRRVPVSTLGTCVHPWPLRMQQAVAKNR